MSSSTFAKSSQDSALQRVGILGIGAFLPEQVRENSWWPANVTATWRVPPSLASDTLSDDEREVAVAMERHRTDPFQGSRRRHVMDPTHSALDLELIAARAALAN